MAVPTIFVIEIAGSGGICHYTVSLLKEFDHSVHAVLYTGCPFEMKDRAGNLDYKCTFRRLRTNPFRVLRMYLDAIRDRPKVAHFQLSQYPGVMLTLMLAFRLFRVPIVTTAHNVVSHELRVWQQVVFRSVYKISQQIIVHSEASKKELVERFDIAEDKTHVIDHGNYMFFDQGRKPRPIQEGDPTFRILFFGFIRRYKGLSVLLDAVRSLNDGSTMFLLDIVGKPVEPFEPYAEFIGKNRLGNVVRTDLRYVSFEKVGEYFSNASVVVLPYLNISQSGVLQLAYAFGKPVIVTATGGLPETVEEGGSGFVVPPGDSAALAERLRQMMQDPNRVRAMGKRARELAETRFSWKQIAPKNQAIYFKGAS